MEYKKNKDEYYFLEKNFKFKNFLESQKFVNEVGNIAEAQGHHPDIIFGWGYAKIQIFTHKENGKGIVKSYEMKADNILEEATISGYKIISKKVLKEWNNLQK